MDIRNKKIGFVSLGCDKNRVDLEKMIYNIKAFGFKITNNYADANVIIVNTCSFIESAREESISAILESASFKENNKLEKLIVTGCINEMQYSDLAESLPEVDAFVNIKDNDKIVDIICNLYNYDSDGYCFDQIKRVITTPKHYAYLKIADGCDNFCSYCKIPYIRGRYYSEKPEKLIKEAEILVKEGVTEIILVAQDVTKYGTDFKDGTTIVTLIKELSKIKKLKWIRLLYCYPESITDELIEEIKNNPKVCKYLDIPLQHVDTEILKSMNRKNNYEKIVQLINKLRLNIPDIALRTTFILGLPGEEEKHFKLLKNFVEEFKLDYVGFFAYSREEGTRAYNFDKQVKEEVKNARLEEISNIQFNVVSNINKQLIGKEFEVVVDAKYDNYVVCRSQYQNPDSDNIIYVFDNTMETGEYYNVRITKTIDYDLEGERV